jgi:hypothetical protein
MQIFMPTKLHRSIICNFLDVLLSYFYISLSYVRVQTHQCNSTFSVICTIVHVPCESVLVPALLFLVNFYMRHIVDNMLHHSCQQQTAELLD